MSSHSLPRTLGDHQTSDYCSSWSISLPRTPSPGLPVPVLFIYYNLTSNGSFFPLECFFQTPSSLTCCLGYFSHSCDWIPDTGASEATYRMKGPSTLTPSLKVARWERWGAGNRSDHGGRGRRLLAHIWVGQESESRQEAKPMQTSRHTHSDPPSPVRLHILKVFQTLRTLLPAGNQVSRSKCHPSRLTVFSPLPHLTQLELALLVRALSTCL